jgi:hypothetical protein
MALVRTGDSEERIASIIGVTRISELVIALAVTSNEPHGVTSQRTVTFIVTAVKASNLTK